MPPRKRSASKPKTCALYHRVSTRDQNPKAAARALREHARRLGMRVELDVEEVGSSREYLPARERVMAAARAGRLDAVIVWKLDRFGRSMIDVVVKLQELKTLGVRFIASTQGIDIGPDGGAAANYYVNTLIAAAEFEREMISERTILGLADARRRGVRLGPPRRKVDLARVLELRGAGRSWDFIADELGLGRETVRRAVERDKRQRAKEAKRPAAAAGGRVFLEGFVERGRAAQAAVDELVQKATGGSDADPVESKLDLKWFEIVDRDQPNGGH